MTTFPDLPDGYDRHHDALFIVDPGACNPAGVALAIHNACRQVIAEGGDQRTDPAIRLMTTQLAFLLNSYSDIPLTDYQTLLDTCRTRAAERSGAAISEGAS